MPFNLEFTNQAKKDLEKLGKDAINNKQLKAVRKALGYLEINPRHPSLNTHKFTAFTGPNGEEVFEAYAQNNTPGAYRIFWYYGPKPKKDNITIVAITPHP